MSDNDENQNKGDDINWVDHAHSLGDGGVMGASLYAAFAYAQSNDLGTLATIAVAAGLGLGAGAVKGFAQKSLGIEYKEQTLTYAFGAGAAVYAGSVLFGDPFVEQQADFGALDNVPAIEMVLAANDTASMPAAVIDDGNEQQFVYLP